MARGATLKLVVMPAMKYTVIMIKYSGNIRPIIPEISGHLKWSVPPRNAGGYLKPALCISMNTKQGHKYLSIFCFDTYVSVLWDTSNVTA